MHGELGLVWWLAPRGIFFDKDDFQERKGRGGLFHDFMVNKITPSSVISQIYIPSM